MYCYQKHVTTHDHSNFGSTVYIELFHVFQLPNCETKIKNKTVTFKDPEYMYADVVRSGDNKVCQCEQNKHNNDQMTKIINRERRK